MRRAAKVRGEDTRHIRFIPPVAHSSLLNLCVTFTVTHSVLRGSAGQRVHLLYNMSMLCFNPLFLIMGSSVPLLQLREIFYSLAYTLGTLSEVA